MNSAVLLFGLPAEIFGRRMTNQGTPIDVAPEDNPANEPEPDLIVLKRDFTQFTQGNPRPEDLQLVVEVSDSTLGSTSE